MSRPFATLALGILILLVSSCALWPPRDPLLIDVVGIEPLPGQGLEVRMAVRLRVQNPNEQAIDYNGVALTLEVNDRPLASGVSAQQGHIGRFSETVLSVPVSISALSVLRQTLGLAQGQRIEALPYTVRGKLAGGVFGTVRFTDSGTLSLPLSSGDW